MINLSNFDFLKDFDDTLYKLGNRIEREVSIAPSAVKADATPFLEYILNKLLNRLGMKYNYQKDFYSQIDAVYRKGLIDYNFKDKIYSAYMLRNKIHDTYEEMVKSEQIVAVDIHKKLFHIAKKYYHDFNDNAEEYKGIPQYEPIELDTSDEEIGLVEVPDFFEIIEFSYDQCVICGEPNHSNYSLYCPKCSRLLDNANNFISIRNYFGKDATFTKEKLIEYGMHEGYANELISHLAVENMIKVAGRFFTFNNMYFDKYMTKIDNYLAVGELITKFREDKIAPAEIKQTYEYKEGLLHHKPFYEFYKIIDHEIINKFERDILTTDDIWDSIEYTTITQKQLETWYMKNLGLYNRGTVNEPFVTFNNRLMGDYIKLKKEGIPDKEIKARLNVSRKVYELWLTLDDTFEDEITQIKKDLFLNALSEGKREDEAIQIAGMTEKDYADLVKYSDFKGDEFSRIRNRELDERKLNLIEYLKHNDLNTSCELAKLSIDDFYKWYDKDMSSDFYLNSTLVLMHNFLNQRRKGKTKIESAEGIGLEYKYVDRWFNRTLDICEKFKNEHIKVIVGLIYNGFKNGKSKREISQAADVSLNRINTYLDLGKRGFGTYKRLYDYYEEHVIPRQLSGFLVEIKNKPTKKALELSELSDDEFKTCCNLGKNGDVRYSEFYHEFYAIRLEIFLRNFNKGKAISKALKNANLTEKELDECYNLGRDGDERYSEFYQKFYNIKLKTYIKEVNRGKSKSDALKKACLDEKELQDDIDDMILDRNMNIVMNSLLNNASTKKAAIAAGIKIGVIYDWFLKGKRGDEKFKDFYDYYYNCYVLPGSVIAQNLIRDGVKVNDILNKYKNVFSREDYKFWHKHGYLAEANEMLKEVEDGEKLVDELLDKSTEYENNLKK